MREVMLVAIRGFIISRWILNRTTAKRTLLDTFDASNFYETETFPQRVIARVEEYCVIFETNSR
jgi:hypothetical protein